ncbi:MAG TPA: DUF4157 domain-containing protein [Flavihumibacter sp.]|jgi:hypothetical protein
MGDTFRIKENSVWARIAAKRMKAEKLAMVLGNTIHLHNTGYEEMLRNRRWLRHELAHVRQFRRYGNTRFILLYVWESIKHGYYKNKYEIEAREAEQDPQMELLYSFSPSPGQQDYSA